VSGHCGVGRALCRPWLAVTPRRNLRSRQPRC
jgi:hypothetical protein